jgi:hypothetical protein
MHMGLLSLMSPHKIDIAKYLSRLESEDIPNPLVAMGLCLEGLADELKTTLGYKEKLETVDGKAPLLESNSTECLMWAAAILASSWTEWIFVSKSSNPKYCQQKSRAAANAKITSPYVRYSIMDAMTQGRKIGRTKRTNFRPEVMQAFIELRKETPTQIENVTEKQLREICKKCIENSNGLVEAAEQLLPNDNTVQYALGLYMYAIEEYGKAHLVKSCFTGPENVSSIPGWIFGWRPGPPSGKNSHEEKLSEGFRNLPPVCLKLSPVIEIVHNTSPKAQTFTIKGPFGDAPLSVGPYQSGIFESSTDIPSRDVDFNLKTACFYVDWDEVNRMPKYLLTANREQLAYNIKRVRDNLAQFDFI